MLFQKSVLRVEIDGKVFEFHCDNDSPLGAVHDSLVQMKSWCLGQMNAVLEKDKEEKIVSIEE